MQQDKSSLPWGTPRPPFIVGVTGHMAIGEDNIQIIKDKIHSVFAWLKSSQLDECETGGTHEPLGLSSTPILVLSSLAPGADQLVAEIAYDHGFQNQCPLPFPTGFYRNASTFRQGERDGNDKIIGITEADPNNAKPVDRQFELPALTDEDKARQQGFDDVVNKIGLHNCFAVLRPEDLNKTDTELEEQYAMDIRDRERRNLRYRSSGDYVSANCDVLIAICDLPDIRSFENRINVGDGSLPPLARCGAREIVQSHVFGIEPGTLPIDTTLTWADNGPAIRIYCPNEKNPKPAENHKTTNDQPEIGSITFWHPLDSMQTEHFEKQWHRTKMDELKSFADRLEELNRDLENAEPAEPGQADVMLMEEKKEFRPTTFFDEPRTKTKKELKKWIRLFRLAGEKNTESQDSSSPQLEPQEKVAVFRRVVANLNRKLDDSIKSLKARLFLWAFFVIVLMQVYENWVTDSMAGSVPGWRTGMFYLAVIIFSVSIFYYYRVRGRNFFDRQNDYRAIAEGVRVQFYWNAAGIVSQAAANFMQRVRGEMSWIREVVAWTGFPCEQHAASFQNLDNRSKLEELKKILNSWVKIQLKFFSKETLIQDARKRRVQFIANMCLVAGLFLLLFNFGQVSYGSSSLVAWFESISKYCGLVPLFLLTAVVIGLYLSAEYVAFRAYKVYYSDNAPNIWTQLFGHLKHFQNPILVWITGAFLGWSIFCMVEYVSRIPAFPNPAQLAAIAKNLIFAVGGLLHTWAAFKFFEENTKRYSASRDLFRASELKIRRILETLKSQIESNEKQLEIDVTIQAVQDYFVVLGQEALHENAEWLIMHRNRPVEPILPTG